MKLKIGKDKTNKQPLPMIGGDGKSSKNSSKPESPADVASTGQKQVKADTKSFNKKYLIIFAGVILIALSGVGVYYFYNSNQDNDIAQQEQEEFEVPAREELEDAIQSESDPTKKAELYREVTTVDQLNNDINSAQQAAQEAVNLDGSADSFAVLAGISEQKGEWAKAAEYYQKAADLSEKSDNPDANTPYNYYISKVNEMKAKL